MARLHGPASCPPYAAALLIHSPLWTGPLPLDLLPTLIGSSALPQPWLY